MITYLSYYPHHNGTLAGKMMLDETLFCLLLALVKDEEQITAAGGEETHLDALIDMIEYGDAGERNLPQVDKELREQLVQFDGDNVYAFFDMLVGMWEDQDGEIAPQKSVKRPAKILRNFRKKGFIAGEWEEGTHALALPGYENAASKAMAKLEAKHTEDEVDSFF